MANFITGSRIIISIAMLFFPVFSPGFYCLYLIAGCSDIADGFVARKTDTVSEYGSKLDTAADMVFAAVCLVKLLPGLQVPVWVYVWTALIAALKLYTMIRGYIKTKGFVAVHSVMNKMTGCLLFALPLTLPFIDLKYSAAAVCAFATVAAVMEGYDVRQMTS